MARVMTAAKITERRVQTNGITLNIAEAGAGPLVLMLHGFPESWYSWRHQMTYFAARGYQVAALNVRGYGGSSHPITVDQYTQTELSADIQAVATALSDDPVILFGHDWGAPQVYTTLGTYPARSFSVGESKGSRSRPSTRVGSSRSSRTAPIEYFRIAPTPWVSTSQPASVSIGEPQLPIWTYSHCSVGFMSSRLECQKWSMSDSI